MFKDLLHDDAQLYGQLAGAIKLQDKPRGSNIIVEGDYGDSFYIILSGKVAVLKAQLIPIDQDKVITKLEEGELEDMSEEELQEIQEHEKEQMYLKALK